MRYKRQTEKPDVNVKQKALDLLLYRTRTEKELKDKLLERGYSDEECEEALDYVRHYGYVDDDDYARRYISAHGREKGAAAIRRELREKGIQEDTLEEVLYDLPDEEEVLEEMLIKKAGEPHSLDEKEFRRLYGFFMRKGFTSGKIIQALKEFQKSE